MPGPERRTAGSPVMDGPDRPAGSAGPDRPAGPAGPDRQGDGRPGDGRPAPVDQLRRARERVRGLARDVERLARSDIAPEQFFAKLLDVLRESLGAPAATVWSLDAGALNLTHERGLEEAGFRDVPRADRAVAPLLSDTLATGESSAKDGSDPTNKLPTAHLYLTAALVTEGTPSGALQVLQRADAPAEARAGFLQFVEQLAGHASEYLTRRKNRGRQAGDLSAGGFWGEFEKAVLLLQRARGVVDVAGVAVNESRRLLDVDRVSLVRRRGRKYPVEAVSGQDTVHKRANLIKRLSKLSKAVMKTREPLLFNGGHRGFDPAEEAAGELPPQISGPLSDYLEESGSRMIAIVPLMSSDRDLGKQDLPPEERHRKKPPEVIGALVVEQVAESRLAPGLTAKLDLLNDHVAAALQSAREDERIFLRGPLRVLGRAQEYLHGRKLLKTLAATAALVAVGLALWLVPYDYRITGEGVLVPAVQRKIFAPFDGEVTAVLVEGGQRVEAGEPLLKVRNDDLQEQIVSTTEQIAEKTAESSNLRSRERIAENAGQLDEARARRGERDVVEAQLAGFRDKLDTAGGAGGEEGRAVPNRRDRRHVPARPPAEGPPRRPRGGAAGGDGRRRPVAAGAGGARHPRRPPGRRDGRGRDRPPAGRVRRRRPAGGDVRRQAGPRDRPGGTGPGTGQRAGGVRHAGRGGRPRPPHDRHGGHRQDRLRRGAPVLRALRGRGRVRPAERLALTAAAGRSRNGAGPRR